MIPYPQIDPEIIRVGPIALRWYGLMYVIGFAASYFLVLDQIKRKAVGISRAVIEDIYFYLIVGLIVGARLGYILFYNLSVYLSDPFQIFNLLGGGMSFHGGAIGTFIAGYIVMKRKKVPFLKAADLIIPTAPIGLFFGRMGNFINGELYGRSTTVPWAMIFPTGGNVARHPSQLYEALLEGLALFFILWWYKDHKKREGDVFALFLISYPFCRIICELFREPDAQLGYFFGFITMGQILSITMLAIGLLIKFAYLPSHGEPASPRAASAIKNK